MPVPLQITFKDLDHSAALETRIREKAALLERFSAHIVNCHVTIEAPHRHQRQGRQYRARIDILVPRGEVVVTKENPRNQTHEDPMVAIRDAFDAAVRQLEDHVRKLGGRTKHHESPLLRGRIARFVAGEGYGFIETGEGEVYFHRNSVVDVPFEELRVGDAVQLAVAEGDKGPQATTVRRAG